VLHGLRANTGRGGNITLVSSGGDITAFDGSVISVDGAACPAGDIAISALPSGKIDLDGLVESKSALTGTGGGQAGGGRITVKAGCDLTVSETGVVRSEGKDPGADLVHLEGCTVTIRGLVQSISDNAGHATNVDNACNGDNVVAHPIGAATIFAGCVEIWAGTTLTIDRTNGFNGEVSADGVRNPNRAWIDLFANGQINILNTATTPYAVHPNAAHGGPARAATPSAGSSRSSPSRATSSPRATRSRPTPSVSAATAATCGSRPTAARCSARRRSRRSAASAATRSAATSRSRPGTGRSS